MIILDIDTPRLKPGDELNACTRSGESIFFTGGVSSICREVSLRAIALKVVPGPSGPEQAR